MYGSGALSEVTSEMAREQNFVPSLSNLVTRSLQPLVLDLNNCVDCAACGVTSNNWVERVEVNPGSCSFFVKLVRHRDWNDARKNATPVVAETSLPLLTAAPVLVAVVVR